MNPPSTLDDVGYIIAIVVAVLGVGAVTAVLLRRRGRPDTEATTAPAPAPTRPDPAPMTGLDDALRQVADERGNTLGELIDAEAPLVDELRVTDDTGPLLRRVLDSVTDPGETPAGEQPSDDGRTHPDA